MSSSITFIEFFIASISSFILVLSSSNAFSSRFNLWILDKYSIGIAHNKVIHLISLYKGITISELLKKLKVTKQSLNRVLNDLIKLKSIKYEKDGVDTRVKHVYLTKEGEKLFEEIFSIQKKGFIMLLLAQTQMKL